VDVIIISTHYNTLIFSSIKLIMAHMLARLKDGKIKDVKAVLEADAANHAKEGLYLEHLWRNVDDPEVLFLFRIDNPILAKRFVRKVHAEALKEDPTVNLPLMTYLEEE
jgi:hypothetical protein